MPVGTLVSLLHGGGYFVGRGTVRVDARSSAPLLMPIPKYPHPLIPPTGRYCRKHEDWMIWYFGEETCMTCLIEQQEAEKQRCPTPRRRG